MSRLALFCLCAAAAVVTASSAEARDGCGRGWFFNGAACVPEGGRGYGYRPEPRYYQEPRYYDEGPRYRGGGGPMYRGRDGRLHCSNPAFTIQDGVCKPYRGG
jgi:hypothetical protein